MSLLCPATISKVFVGRKRGRTFVGWQKTTRRVRCASECEPMAARRRTVKPKSVSPSVVGDRRRNGGVAWRKGGIVTKCKAKSNMLFIHFSFPNGMERGQRIGTLWWSFLVCRCTYAHWRRPYLSLSALVRHSSFKHAVNSKNELMSPFCNFFPFSIGSGAFIHLLLCFCFLIKFPCTLPTRSALTKFAIILDHCMIGKIVLLYDFCEVISTK